MPSVTCAAATRLLIGRGDDNRQRRGVSGDLGGVSCPLSLLSFRCLEVVSSMGAKLIRTSVLHTAVRDASYPLNLCSVSVVVPFVVPLAHSASVMLPSVVHLAP